MIDRIDFLVRKLSWSQFTQVIYYILANLIVFVDHALTNDICRDTDIVTGAILLKKHRCILATVKGTHPFLRVVISNLRYY